ncbi:ribonuclease [Novosphingobium sp.]|uniref:ribonuclease n=1 Tax=Novosphingobium sp. TaxID=1874826 RepID=UPI003D119B58
MPEWLVEPGIGEDRAILVDHGTIVAARVCWREPWRAGAVSVARLDHRYPGSKRGAVHMPDGTIATIDALPADVTHGATLMVRITRAALAEQGRFKLAQCRAAGDAAAAPAPAPSLAETLAQTGSPVRILGGLDRSFDEAGWDDLIEQAQTGAIDFPGGRLTISPTPAMTLIDIDGPPPLLPLALASVPAIARTLARLDIAGSVGIDFPGQDTRADRQAIDLALDAALAATGWHGERTGMNGFGFVQLITRLERASLVARLAFHPARAAAHALLRQAERVAGPGTLMLVAHPAVLAAIAPPLEAELARRTGRLVRKDPRNTLALHAGFAQATTS